jgi:hypothetical protein
LELWVWLPAAPSLSSDANMLSPRSSDFNTKKGGASAHASMRGKVKRTKVRRATPGMARTVPHHFGLPPMPVPLACCGTGPQYALNQVIWCRGRVQAASRSSEPARKQRVAK